MLKNRIIIVLAAALLITGCGVLWGAAQPSSLLAKVNPGVNGPLSASVSSLFLTIDHQVQHDVGLIAAQARARVNLRAATQAGAQASLDAPRPLGRVVMIGDSMAWPIGLALNRIFEAEGGGETFRYLHLTNDALHAWQRDRHSRLREMLETKRPDTVLIVMGTNDFLHPNVEMLTETIVQTEALIHPRPCYWIGPPKLWKADTGIVDLLARTTRHCRYLDSKPLKIDRGRDGWHPSPEGSATWARAIRDYIAAQPFAWSTAKEVRR